MTRDESQAGKVESEKIAVPVEDGVLAVHFGHCRKFAMLDVDRGAGKLLKREDVDAPPHQPGLLPAWLSERGVNTVLAGGMGQRAISLFAERGLKVYLGIPSEPPEDLVASYLAGTLKVGENVCDH